MLKQMRNFIAGIVVGALLFGTAAYASASINVDFLPIKFIFDGAEKSLPAGQTGFIYQGSTYVPLRFVSESLGKAVSWDGGTNTAYIGKTAVQASAASASAFATYKNDADGYSLNVPSGIKISSVPSKDGGSQMMGIKSLGGSFITMAFSKSRMENSVLDIETVGSLTEDMIKGNAEYVFIRRDQLVVGNHDALHYVYTHKNGTKALYINEYYIFDGADRYDLNFVTQTEPNKESQAVIDEAIASFKTLN